MIVENFELESEKAFWPAYFGSHPDPVAILGQSDEFVWTNDAFDRWQRNEFQTVQSLRSVLATTRPQKQIREAIAQKTSARFWLNHIDKSFEITVSPIDTPTDKHCAVLYFKPWEAPNLGMVSGDWSVYLSLMQNPFIGVWRISFPQSIDVSQSTREIAEIMFDTGVFVECNETMAKMYRFPNVESMLGKSIQMLYPSREPVIQRIMAMIQNGFRSELMDSVEVDQNGKTKAFRNAYFGHVSNGHMEWVSGIQLDITERHQAQVRFEVLYNIAHSVIESDNLVTLYQAIRENLMQAIDTTNLYIVSVNPVSQEMEMAVNFDSAGNINPPTHRSMVARVIEKEQAIILHRHEIVALKQSGDIDIEEPLPVSWVGVPLQVDESVTGALVVQSYEETLYTDDDLKMLQFVSAQVALAIHRKEAFDDSLRYRRKLESIIRNVPEAVYTALDRLGTTTFISDQWEVWTGVPAMRFLEHPETWQECLHPEDRAQVVAQYVEACEAGDDYLLDYRVLHQETGEITYLRDKGTLVKDEQGGHYDGIISNVTDFKITESRLRASVKEKELLLKEVHHRVKNNLQIVMSLLNLQARKSKSETVKSDLSESRNRVRTMAMIHEKLYQSKNLTHIDFKSYVNTLCRELYRAYELTEGRVKLNLEIENIPLTIDFAVPCGLIINELVSNAFKYAFPASQTQEKIITLRLHRSDQNTLLLSVADNGVGFENHQKSANGESLGLHLVRILVEDQLDGTLNIENNGGCTFQMTFPLKRDTVMTTTAEIAS